MNDEIRLMRCGLLYGVSGLFRRFVSSDASHTRLKDNIIWDLVDDIRDRLVPGESAWLMSPISILYICCRRVATWAIYASFRDNILHFILEIPWQYALGPPHISQSYFL